VRLADDTVLLTPAGVNKARLLPGSLARVALDGRILEGRPSTERAMHLSVYRACADARVVVHAHPPTAIAWTLARPGLTELPTDALPELILAAGRVPIVPYARPGTEEMGTALRPFLPEHRLLLLARHGALAWGESMEEAVNGIERLEHSALILKAAEELGGLSPLPPLELEALRALRARIGPRLL
jgi:L-fuculose-phosphate aldolase